MNSLQSSPIRQTLPAMRVMLVIAGILVFSVGITLNLLTEQTDRFFAWTIATPLTAAFLGAAYWSSCILEILAARERIWARALIAIPAVLLFTILTLVITLVHIDRFHFDSPELITRLGTWFWLFIYAVVPIVMSILLFLQIRVRGVDPLRASPPPGWIRLILAIQAGVMLLLGIALLLVPLAVAPYWPWSLTPLTGRAIGAWFFSIGIASAQSVLENDLERVRIATIAYFVIGFLELIALARFTRDVNWTGASAWLYLVFLISLCLLGAASWFAARNESNTNGKSKIPKQIDRS